MIIEIKGTNSQNKGAEMMLLTILKELEAKDIKFTITPKKNSCEYPFYTKLGLFPKVWFSYRGFQFGKFGRFIPKKIRDLYGLIVDEEVDIILDASGFAYSSQWGNSPTKTMSEESKRWKDKNKKVILLPQAFGPFENTTIKSHMKEIIENATLIYARDQFSYDALKTIKDDKKIKLYPDFTVLFKGKKPNYFDEAMHQICIVPNQRMKDKVTDTKNYEQFFAKIIEMFQLKNLSPFFLIHGGEEDKKLAEKINMLLDNKIDIISEEDPYLIKGIIENSIGLIGSRFHSIASALYSGIPTIGMGWSHKYEYLFNEFNFAEGLIDLTISDKELYNKLELIINSKNRLEIQLKLLNHKQGVEEKTIQMFKEVKNKIGLI